MTPATVRSDPQPSPEASDLPATLVSIGRLGWYAKGTVYVLVGALAFRVAWEKSSGSRGSADGEASRSGALETVSEQTFGGVVLVALAIGLALYAGWRLVTSMLPGDGDLHSWVHRGGYVLSAAVYAGLAWSAISFVLTDAGGDSSDPSTLERVSRTVLGAPAGRWLLTVGALVALAVAWRFAARGLDGTYLEDVDLAGASKRRRRIVTVLGTAGWLGRAGTVALLALFVLQAAIDADPDDAEGLDGALREVADTTWGSVLVACVAVALLAYGAFAIVSASRRRIHGP